MRRRLLLTSATLPLFLVGLVYGCSSEPPVEDLCAWISKDNCYLDFHKTVQDACAAPGATGTFLTRTTLDTCIITQGGSVIFDPPLEVTKFPPKGEKGMGIKMTFITPTGGECGNVTYTEQFTFSLTVNAPDGGMMGSGSSGGGGAGPDGGMIYGGTFTATTPEGRQILDVACPNSLETHHFDRLQVSAHGATGNENVLGCPSYANIIPQAILEASPGGIQADGFVKLTIRFPPAAGVDPKATAAIPPDEIVYFNCTIPGAPLQCQNGMMDGEETAVDCGGRETSGNCPARCMAGQVCKDDCDCDAATSCQVNPMDGSTKCAVGSKTKTCTLICSNGIKDFNETDVDCGGGGCSPCSDGKGCLAGKDCASGSCVGGVCTMPNCMDQTKNGTETDVDCGGTCVGQNKPCAAGQGCVTSSDCVPNLGCVNGVCSLCGDGMQSPGESDVDCGGPTCPKCTDGNVCMVASDCVSNICNGTICVSCTDGIKNGSESDVDCGGAACPKCAEGKACSIGIDCMYGVCETTMPKTCNTCGDMVKDGTETDIDCGGNCVAKGKKCGPGLGCAVNADCVSNVCNVALMRCQ